MAKLKAKAIIEDVRYSTVVFNDEKNIYKHLGTVGEYFFVCPLDTTKIILKAKMHVAQIQIGFVEAKQERKSENPPPPSKLP